MRRVVLPPTPPWDDALHAAAAVLSRGGVIVAATETVYGLMTLWGNRIGRERIYRMKGRTADKPLQMLARSLDAGIAAGLESHPALERLAATFWPGPLTVVAPAAAGDWIGLRIPAHPFLLDLLDVLGQPLAATSANRSGAPPATNPDDAVRDLTEAPDLLADAGRIEQGGTASTVVRFSPPDHIELLRPGPITIERIMGALRSG